jgi:ATP-dependent Lhr-like helicase
MSKIVLESASENQSQRGKPSETEKAKASELNDIKEEQKIAEDWAWQLLRRWGVVFRDLLAREDGAPSWFEILQLLRRLEARGEIRGGRFIADVAGEQFALPDSVQQLRRLRDAGPAKEIVILSAADPLNLVGIITRQERVPRTASNRVVYLDGVCVACLQGGEARWFNDVPREMVAIILDRLRNKSILSAEPNSVPNETIAETAETFAAHIGN